MQRLIVVFFFIFLAINMYQSDAYAAKILNIDANASMPLKSNDDIKRIAIGSAEIATIVQIPQNLREFLIVAKKAGATTLYVWTTDGKRHDYIVNVSSEDIGVALAIEEAIGLPEVKVKKVQNRILLTGFVENQHERNYALQVARLYVEGSSDVNLSVGTGPNLQLQTESSSNESGSLSGSKIQLGSEPLTLQSQIIDLLQMRNPTQIKLEAQVISINPTDRENLGIQYGNTPGNAPGVFVFGEDYNSNTGTPFRNNPLAWAMDRHNAINLQVQALLTKNRAKLLSRPSIMTMSGEQALIQVGGQIPYTIVSTNNVAYTTFKNYGIILQLKPIVDGTGKIISSVHAEVSSMTGETVDGQPILAIRRADSVVTMTSGSTIVIGGLMDSSEQKHVTKIPFLGDIPILGEFFKYTSKTKEKQELIILVTPYIVEKASQAKMSDEMEKYYRGGQIEKAQMREVDLNEEIID